MKKLTAGILTVMLGLVAADANAAVTSKKYVDDALKATNNALTETINTTKTELTGKIEKVEGDVTNIQGNITTINETLGTITGTGKDGIAAKIAAAVKEEADRAKGAEEKLTTDLATEKTRAEAAEKTLTDNLAAEVTRADTAEKKIAGDLATYQTSNDAAVALKADKSDTYTKKEVDDKDAAVDAHIGTLSDLTTTAKTSAVAAINELDAGVTANATEISKIKAGTALADGAVTEAKIAADAVTTGKIKNGAVTADKIATDAVTTGKIENGAVTADKIATDAVTTDKIKDGAVTSGKLAAVTTAGTGTKMTYNAQGQVTKSEGLTAEDIPTLTADKISNLNKLASAELPASCNQPGANCVLKFNGTTYTWEDIADEYTPAQ